MRVENFSLDSSRDENCAEQQTRPVFRSAALGRGRESLKDRSALPGCNEIAQAGGVGDNRHRELLELSCSVREFFKCSRFTV